MVSIFKYGIPLLLVFSSPYVFVVYKFHSAPSHLKVFRDEIHYFKEISFHPIADFLNKPFYALIYFHTNFMGYHEPHYAPSDLNAYWFIKKVTSNQSLHGRMPRMFLVNQCLPVRHSP